MAIPADAVPFDPALVKHIRRILSVAECGVPDWDPSSVYIYADDNRFNPPRKQVTLSVGFTENGNLKKVLQRYCDQGGALSPLIVPYLPTMGLQSSPTLATNSTFVSLLKKVGAEPIMKAVQEEMFEELYLAKAFAWCKANGFALPLSFLVVADSFLHSGSMLSFLMAKFPDKKPGAGGDEKKWIVAYIKARNEWLSGHSNPILRKTNYRVNCFAGEVARNNWNLEEHPTVMNGTKVFKVA